MLSAPGRYNAPVTRERRPRRRRQAADRKEKTMKNLDLLKQEMAETVRPVRNVFEYYLALGLSAHYDDPNVVARAFGIQALFEKHEKHLYENDLIAGSICGLTTDAVSADDLAWASRIVGSYGYRNFPTNSDHFAPDYETVLKIGIGGLLERIAASKEAHRNDPDREKKAAFLTAAEISMNALAALCLGYAEEAEKKGKPEIAAACRAVSRHAPTSFREALQLVFLIHTGFLLEGRYAMALGRMDQYLYPFYRHDLDAGILTREEALSLTECALYKIYERRRYFGGDDVVNIAIGGVKPEDGSDAVNELTHLILDAVEECGIPGPNLSARVSARNPDSFLSHCLAVIGTGIGYPALMNDEINMAALRRHGYAEEDVRNYCMVGCIENFIAGKQPPWSDGRYNSPKFVELALNNGICMLTGKRLGPETGDASAFDTMEKFMAAVEAQMRYAASEYMAFFRNTNDRLNRVNYMQPYLSCFCRDCIGRGLDINDGGSLYPSAHAPGLMGIGTVSDSLAAIEKTVYIDRTLSLPELRDILKTDYEGREDIRERLLDAPKYGNNDPLADRYAVWFVQFQESLFARYRTPDGGPVYIAIASNISNIPAGKEVAATPDGRHAGEPLSDAASPMHGMDRRGPTAAYLSLAKPDYSLAACGTVVNQKFSPEMLTDPEKRARVGALIRTYFEMGGQEIQINSVSRETLKDAMEHPENYRDLVVRVSGFSAHYVLLDREVQLDILRRTEHHG